MAEAFELADFLKNEKAVISLRKSPGAIISGRDYAEVLQYEREHPEIYEQPGVYEPDSSLRPEVLAGFQFQAFNSMFYSQKAEAPKPKIEVDRARTMSSFSIPLQQLLRRGVSNDSEAFELCDLLKAEKAVISLRKSPHIWINYKDYHDVLQYEREHPEIYEQPGVYEPDGGLNHKELMGFQMRAFNFIFQKKEPAQHNPHSKASEASDDS